MSDTNPTARPLLAWMDVLDHIDQSLGLSLARTPEPAPAADIAEPAKDHLVRLDERLAAWQSSLEQVEIQAAASTERMNAEHAALGEWLGKLGQVREGFSRWIDSHARP